MKRHHIFVPDTGTAVVAVLEDDQGALQHITVDAPAERRALLAQTTVFPVFGQARERYRKARAEVEGRVFVMAERQFTQSQGAR